MKCRRPMWCLLVVLGVCLVSSGSWYALGQQANQPETSPPAPGPAVEAAPPVGLPPSAVPLTSPPPGAGGGSLAPAPEIGLPTTRPSPVPQPPVFGMGWGGGGVIGPNPQPVPMGQGGQMPVYVVRTQVASEFANLVKQYLEAKDDQKKLTRQRLVEALGKQYDEQRAQQKREIDDLQSQLKRLEDLMKKRDAARQQIIDRRIDQLVQEAQGLGWLPSAPGQPGTTGSAYGQQFGFAGGGRSYSYPGGIFTAPPRASFAEKAPSPGGPGGKSAKRTKGKEAPKANDTNHLKVPDVAQPQSKPEGPAAKAEEPPAKL